jgi:CheY-like chemotaxis protein
MGMRFIMNDHRPPDTFVESVKAALENLYDFPSLNRHPLASATFHEPGGYRLRRELISAIESLNPGAKVALNSSAARVYNLLKMHFVGSMTLQEVANDLGISLRQAYRDLRHGCESVAEILWFSRSSTSIPSAYSVESEVERLDCTLIPADVTAMFDAAVKAVRPLAERQGLTLNVQSQPVTLLTNPVAVQQTLIHLLSQAVQQASPGTLDAHLTKVNDDACLEIVYTPQNGDELRIEPVIQAFIRQFHLQVTQDWHTDTRRVRLKIPVHGPTVFIIDDNEGLLDLLQRYFTGQPYNVVTVSSSLEALPQVETLQPDAVIMDLMMPEMDGWELLQRLRANPATHHIPVIICSVIRDPALAYSLGASLFITKPVERESILNALKTVGL